MTKYMQPRQQLESSVHRAEIRKKRCNMDLHQQPKVRNRKVPVVYYLCRNRQLEQPHFIEVSLVSPDGLYLRDVIEKFDALRGRGMASMYSWSCKRSYKNAFVWNDLCEDDLIFPVHGNEYVLKGSELVEEHDSGRFAPKLQNSKQLPKQLSSTTQDECSSSTSMKHNDDSHSVTKYKIYKTHDLTDASTQTEESVNVQKIQEPSTRSIESSTNDSSPPSSSSETDTLESLMKADGVDLNSFIKDEEEEQNPTNSKVRASNVILQLISCGSISSEEDNIGRISSSYRSKSLDSKLRSGLLSSSVMLRELEDNEYLKLFKSSVKRSSSFSGNRMSKRDSALKNTKCIPKSIKPRSTSMEDNKENVIKIEERLASGARVIIHLEAPCNSTKEFEDGIWKEEDER